ESRHFRYHMVGFVSHARAQEEIAFVGPPAKVLSVQAKVDSVVFQGRYSGEVGIQGDELSILIALFTLVRRRKEANPRFRSCRVGRGYPNRFPKQNAATASAVSTEIGHTEGFKVLTREEANNVLLLYALNPRSAGHIKVLLGRKVVLRLSVNVWTD